MTRQFKVLSIDGGGIRGIIPAMILEDIESRTGKPISTLFDLIIGTSTGGILALALSKPGPDGMPEYTAKSLINLYEDEGSDIFRRSWRKYIPLSSFAEEMYDSAGIEFVLEKYFQDLTLKDAIIPILVTSYDLELRQPFLFSSRMARKDQKNNFSMKTVARATSAAPTYFEPARVQTEKSIDYYSLIDGGVFANNPSMIGYVEARSECSDDDSVLLLSLGTGVMTRSFSYDEVAGWGKAKWARPILDIVFDGQSDSINMQLEQIRLTSSTALSDYYRIQAELSDENEAMDDASTENIRSLKVLAERLINDSEDKLIEICNKLNET